MKTALLLLLLTACATTHSPSSGFAIGWASTVKVTTNLGHGTGTVVSSRCILSADHVIEGATGGAQAVFDNGTIVNLAVSKEDKDIDLALLCSDTILPAPVAKRVIPSVDDPVYVPGYPLIFKTVTEGRYEGRSVITATCAPGNSGGGVFNSKGEFVGMVDAIATYPMGSSVAVFPHLCMIVDEVDIEAFLGGGYGTT